MKAKQIHLIADIQMYNNDESYTIPEKLIIYKWDVEDNLVISSTPTATTSIFDLTISNSGDCNSVIEIPPSELNKVLTTLELPTIDRPVHIKLPISGDLSIIQFLLSSCNSIRIRNFNLLYTEIDHVE